MKQVKETIQDEIKREFQLERMILFSDAVFAIVITLMAIEIHIPQSVGIRTSETFLKDLFHVLPAILAYTISFFFIGIIWSRHLWVFSFLKDYDNGLIFRNLLLLFFVGLFPFSASLITRYGGISGPYIVYMSVIVLCLTAQLILQTYIFKKRPNLRYPVSVEKELFHLSQMKFNIIILVTGAALTFITFNYVQQEYKVYTFIWLWTAAIIMRIRQKIVKTRHKKLNPEIAKD